MKLWRITPNEKGAEPFTVEAESAKQASELALPRLQGFGGIVEEENRTFTPTINGQTGKG